LGYTSPRRQRSMTSYTPSSGCVCVKPGTCPVRGRRVGTREWELCSDRCPPERPCPELKGATDATPAGVRRTPAAVAQFRLDCTHRGEVVRKPKCGCQGVSVYACSEYGECVVRLADAVKAAKQADNVTLIQLTAPAACEGCKKYTPKVKPAEKPLAGIPLPCVQQSAPPVRLDQHNLAVGTPGVRFNTSLIEWKDGYLMAFRNGWRGSEIYVVPLDGELREIGPAVKLNLTHSEANYGREDPRLFYFRGKIHVAYIGVVGGSLIRHTSVLYARLSDSLRVEQVYCPHYPQRNLWEKNWSFFEHDGQLYAIYSIAPHRILSIDGERTKLAYETPTVAPWNPGTEMRGGASPVKVGDEFYHFFHSRVASGNHRVYITGLYTFDAEPPFRVRRMIPDPIDVADRSTKPRDQYASVVFVCGAVLK
jgi:hypothetical protein